MSEKSHHTKIREDFFTHAKTAALSPVARCVWLYACLHPYLGIVRQSKRMIAKAIGSSEGEVSTAIHQLTYDGLTMWWDEYEVLWLKERASENCTNQNFWKGCEKEAAALPAPVREAVTERYGQSWGLVPLTLPLTLPQGLPQTQPQGLSPCYVMSMPMHMDPSPDPHSAVAAFREAWTPIISALRTDLGPTNDPTRDPQAYAGLCEALTQHGHDLVLAVTEWAVRKEPTGKLTATMFRGAGFGAHLDAYVASQKAERGRAMVAPHKLEGRVLTDAEQREWVKAASGGSDPEVALRAAWAAEEQQANELARELWPA